MNSETFLQYDFLLSLFTPRHLVIILILAFKVQAYTVQF